MALLSQKGGFSKSRCDVKFYRKKTDVSQRGVRARHYRIVAIEGSFQGLDFVVMGRSYRRTTPSASVRHLDLWHQRAQNFRRRMLNNEE